jgi:SagB-type dehydrogenase family enzyme
LPAVKPAAPDADGRIIPLRRPTAADTAADPPFAAVLEARRSIREYGETPISARQLGEFLHRVACVRELRPANADLSGAYETTLRPYPGGGACYELELYLVVQRCLNLPAGLYHYDPLAHCLRRLCGPSPRTEALLAHAAGAGGIPAGAPQVLIGVTARFARVSWKYGGLAYALVLKDVGALYQTMYLVATAMGLAPCALGGGDSDLLAAAIGSDYFAESAVGEFLLGSRPDGGGRTAPAPAGKRAQVQPGADDASGDRTAPASAAGRGAGPPSLPQLRPRRGRRAPHRLDRHSPPESGPDPPTPEKD